MNMHLKHTLPLAGLLALAAAQGANAQNVRSQATSVEPDRMLVVTPGALPATNAFVHVMAGEGRVVGDVVTGKPYSADSVTETIQMLADGNRIVSSNRSRVYRDSEGRTRTEQTLTRLGAWPAAEEPVTMITIDDPVAKVSYFLDPVARTARELRPFNFELARTEPAVPAAGMAVEPSAVVMRRVAPNVGVATPGTPVSPPIIAAGSVQSVAINGGPSMNVRTDDLGEQVVQGVLARGTRQTQTIPPGAIGNDWAIDIVTETWYSDELEALMSRRTSDPRFGETVYQLVNVVRDEPAPDLFAIPQDYEVVSASSGPSLSSFFLEPARPGERVDLRILRSPEEDAQN